MNNNSNTFIYELQNDIAFQLEEDHKKQVFNPEFSPKKPSNSFSNNVTPIMFKPELPRTPISQYATLSTLYENSNPQQQSQFEK